MSYNGIGLSTARGSGTNGFIQRNLSHVKAKPVYRPDTSNYLQAPEHQLSRPANKDILDHERKRLVEIKCLELEDQLIEKGLDEEEIDSRVDKLRQELLGDLERFTAKAKIMKEWQTHQLAEAKEREIQRFGEALGISKDHTIGAAFDKELQEQKKFERMQERTKRKVEAEASQHADKLLSELAKEAKQKHQSPFLNSPSPRITTRSISPERRSSISRSRSPVRSKRSSPSPKRHKSPISDTSSPRRRRSPSHSPPRKRTNRRASPSRSPSPRYRKRSISPPLRTRRTSNGSDAYLVE